MTTSSPPSSFSSSSLVNSNSNNNNWKNVIPLKNINSTSINSSYYNNNNTSSLLSSSSLYNGGDSSSWMTAIMSTTTTTTATTDNDHHYAFKSFSTPSTSPSASVNNNNNNNNFAAFASAAASNATSKDTHLMSDLLNLLKKGADPEACGIMPPHSAFLPPSLKTSSLSATHNNNAFNTMLIPPPSPTMSSSAESMLVPSLISGNMSVLDTISLLDGQSDFLGPSAATAHQQQQFPSSSSSSPSSLSFEQQHQQGSSPANKALVDMLGMLSCDGDRPFLLSSHDTVTSVSSPAPPSSPDPFPDNMDPLNAISLSSQSNLSEIDLLSSLLDEGLVGQDLVKDSPSTSDELNDSGLASISLLNSDAVGVPGIPTAPVPPVVPTNPATRTSLAHPVARMTNAHAPNHGKFQPMKVTTPSWKTAAPLRNKTFPPMDASFTNTAQQNSFFSPTPPPAPFSSGSSFVNRSSADPFALPPQPANIDFIATTPPPFHAAVNPLVSVNAMAQMTAFDSPLDAATLNLLASLQPLTPTRCGSSLDITEDRSATLKALEEALDSSAATAAQIMAPKAFPTLNIPWNKRLNNTPINNRTTLPTQTYTPPLTPGLSKQPSSSSSSTPAATANVPFTSPPTPPVQQNPTPPIPESITPRTNSPLSKYEPWVRLPRTSIALPASIASNLSATPSPLPSGGVGLGLQRTDEMSMSPQAMCQSPEATPLTNYASSAAAAAKEKEEKKKKQYQGDQDAVDAAKAAKKAAKLTKKRQREEESQVQQQQLQQGQSRSGTVAEQQPVLPVSPVVATPAAVADPVAKKRKYQKKKKAGEEDAEPVSPVVLAVATPTATQQLQQQQQTSREGPPTFITTIGLSEVPKVFQLSLISLPLPNGTTQHSVASIHPLGSIVPTTQSPSLPLETLNPAAPLHAAITHVVNTALSQGCREVELFMCEVAGCCKRFPTVYAVKSHLKCHGEAKLECQDCGTQFRRNHDLVRHMRSMHNAGKPHPCPNCDKAFPRADALRRHLRTVSSFRCTGVPPPAAEEIAEAERALAAKHAAIADGTAGKKRKKPVPVAASGAAADGDDEMMVEERSGVKRRVVKSTVGGGGGAMDDGTGGVVGGSVIEAVPA